MATKKQNQTAEESKKVTELLNRLSVLEGDNRSQENIIMQMEERVQALSTYCSDLDTRQAVLLKVLAMIGSGEPFDHLVQKMKSAAVSTLAEVARLPLRKA